jgi:hypothetical protein
VECCGTLKKDGLKAVLDKHHYTGVIVGVRRDEEPTRAKERYFSPRDKNMEWNVEDQPPELWDQFKTDYEKGTHIRIHPLLHWTELNVWEYIERENIPSSRSISPTKKASVTAASAARPALSHQIQTRATCAKSSKNCATPKPPSVPAAPRTRKAKTPSKNCAATLHDTCRARLRRALIRFLSSPSSRIIPRIRVYAFSNVFG